MRFGGMDMTYMLLVMLPGMALSGIASFLVKRTFSKFEKVGTSGNMTGAEAAHLMLTRAGVTNCTIEPNSGRLSDHYDPRSRTLRLSVPVYGERSISAIGVACHEAGHALQHAQGYKFLKMRSALVPVTNLSSKLSMPILIAGGVLASVAPIIGQWVLMAGVALFAVAFLFSVVTLPVEWDASARAKKAMVEHNIISPDELNGAGKVLNAAFLTYLASAISAALTVIYYLMRSGLLRGRR